MRTDLRDEKKQMGFDEANIIRVRHLYGALATGFRLLTGRRNRFFLMT